MRLVCLISFVIVAALASLGTAQMTHISDVESLFAKSMDYDPLREVNNETMARLFQDMDDKTLQDLFTGELQKIISKGANNNHVWNLFLEFLPGQKSDVESRPTVSSHASARRIFTRQANVPMNGNVGQMALQSSDNSRKVDALATVGLKVSQNLVNAMAQESAKTNIANLATVRAPSAFCPFQANINCNPSERFSRPDGSCNNLQLPWLGKAETPYKRYLPPSYDDGLNEPHSRGKSGRPLPNPRVISRALFTDNQQSEIFYSHMLAIFGQFLAHDITSASVSSDASGGVIDCPCNSNNPACMSVPMPSNENVMRMSCMKFTRSSSAFSSFDCQLGHREQLNLLTSFVDGSQIYGPSDSRSRQLRSFQGGQLKASAGVTGRPFLVQATDLSCRDTDATRKCFAAGEGRTNENLGLTGIQNLFMREHNRIATELSRVNPQWDDERLFQEARKALIAIMQHIVYNEWLPTVIGFNTAALFDLLPQSSDTFFSGYDPSVNPQLAGEFATAAFRFGHTLVRNQFGRFNMNNQMIANPSNLTDIIFRPVEAYNGFAGGLDSFVIGLINEPSRKFDTNIADALQNHLFEFKLSDNSVLAIDLAATNINRGRDHGIPSYNDLRVKCGFSRANSFQDFGTLISPDKVQILASLYETPDDVDFYVGGLSETPTSGSVIGPTFACIVANQFKDLKRGDRFYYENGPSATSFTLDQLKEIKKASMAKLLCNNYDLSEVQPNAFLLPNQSINNARVSCSFMFSPDFKKWKQ